MHETTTRFLSNDLSEHSSIKEPWQCLLSSLSLKGVCVPFGCSISTEMIVPLGLYLYTVMLVVLSLKLPFEAASSAVYGVCNDAFMFSFLVPLK